MDLIHQGVIAPGSDADLVVYDPNAGHVLSVDSHRMNMDFSAWDGIEMAGAVAAA